MSVFYQKFFPKFCGKILKISTVILKSSESLWNVKKNFSSRNSGNTFAMEVIQRHVCGIRTTSHIGSCSGGCSPRNHVSSSQSHGCII